MTTARALREGAGRLGAGWRAVLILYAATAGAALLATGGLMSVAWASLGHSAWAPRMLANFDLEWVAEVAAQAGRLAVPVVFASLSVVVVFAVVYLFLAGGALEVLCAGGTSFFGGCGKYFWRLARLAAWSGLGAVAPVAAGSLVGHIGAKVWGEGSAAGPLVYWGWFRLAVVLVGLGVVNLAFDYAAIGMAVEDSRNSRRALGAAMRMIFGYPGKTLALAGALWALLALVMGAGAGISRMASPGSVAAVTALFLFRQAVVLAKTWCWLLFLAAQAVMWQALRREDAPAPAVRTADMPAAESDDGGAPAAEAAQPEQPEATETE